MDTVQDHKLCGSFAASGGHSSCRRMDVESRFRWTLVVSRISTPQNLQKRQVIVPVITLQYTHLTHVVLTLRLGHHGPVHCNCGGEREKVALWNKCEQAAFPGCPAWDPRARWDRNKAGTDVQICSGRQTILHTPKHPKNDASHLRARLALPRHHRDRSFAWKDPKKTVSYPATVPRLGDKARVPRDKNRFLMDDVKPAGNEPTKILTWVQFS